MRLTREAFLAAEDTQTEEVDLSDIPGFNGSLLVRGMTGRERDEFEASMLIQAAGQGARDLRNARAKLVAKCVVDDDGKRLFTDADVAAIGEKSAAAVARLFDVASRLSGLNEEDVQARERDFPAPTGSGSSTGLPNGSAALSGAS